MALAAGTIDVERHDAVGHEFAPVGDAPVSAIGYGLSLDDRSPAPRDSLPGRFIGRFERDRNVPARLEEQGHLRQGIADSHRLDEGAHAHFRLESQNIGPKLRGMLLRQRVMVWGNNSAIEQPLDLLDPGVMEVVEDAGVDTGPVVNWHERSTRKSL
jgi:hypothetical protein